MRKSQTVSVPQPILVGFSEALSKHQYPHQIGKSIVDGESLVEIDYESNQEKEVNQIRKALTEFKKRCFPRQKK